MRIWIATVAGLAWSRTGGREGRMILWWLLAIGLLVLSLACIIRMAGDARQARSRRTLFGLLGVLGACGSLAALYSLSRQAMIESIIEGLKDF